MSDTETETTEPGTTPEPEPVETPESPDEPEPTEDAEEEPEGAEEPGDEQLRQAGQQASAQTAVEVERKNRALEKEAIRHGNRVSEILEADIRGLMACPLCLPLIPGFTRPVPPVGEQLAAVKEAIGEPAEPLLKADTYSRRCDACDGEGRVKTGSKVLGKEKVFCKPCGGDGWVAVGPERADKALTAGNGPHPATQYVIPDVATNDPPEVAALKALGYVVVAPIAPMQAPIA